MANMNALVYYPPGGPDQLKYETYPVPEPLDHGEMLVKVSATGVMYQEPYWPIYQAKDGTYPPQILCSDFSGTVVKIGPGFEGSDIQVGSEIMAFTTTRHDSGPKQGMKKYQGAAAEFAIATLDTAVLKPKNMSARDSATVPLPALTAWQALYDYGNLQAGQKVLITGTAGMTGLWAAQLALLTGAEVTGTASSQRSFDLLHELGVQNIINYKTHHLEDAITEKMDLVLDCVGDTVGGDILQQCAKVVKSDGKIVSIVDFMASKQVPDGINAQFFIVEMKKDQLKKIGNMIEARKLHSFVDSVFPLEKAVEAFRKGAEGHAHGRILLTIDA